MLPDGGPGGLNLGANWTPLVRNVLVALFAIYVVQLALGGLLEHWLAWQPIGRGFRPWQPFTAFLLGDRAPLWTFLNWLVLFFLLAPLDRVLGRRGLLTAVGVAWAAAVLAGLVAGVLGASQSAAFVGLGPLLLAMVALFGFTVPNAQFLFMFVLPMRAAWLGWGSGLLAFLYMLATREVAHVIGFFAWVGAWGWSAWEGGAWRRFKLRRQRARIEKQLSRFEVLDGGRAGAPRQKKKDDWVH